jgi:hypothetical protein
MVAHPELILSLSRTKGERTSRLGSIEKNEPRIFAAVKHVR